MVYKIENVRRISLIAVFLSFWAFALSGCGCGGSVREIKVLDVDSISSAVAPEKNKIINSFQSYLKELDHVLIMKRIKKNAGNDIFIYTTTEITVVSPYEEAFGEGMKYYNASRFDDATRSFKRALSYPNVPPFKTLEIKFLLMDSLRQSGKEPEYVSQLNEYKQKHHEILGAAGSEFNLNQQKSAVIFTVLEKSGEKVSANVENDKRQDK